MCIYIYIYIYTHSIHVCICICIWRSPCAAQGARPHPEGAPGAGAHVSPRAYCGAQYDTDTCIDIDTDTSFMNNALSANTCGSEQVKGFTCSYSFGKL